MKGTPAAGFFFDQIEILAFADAETLDGEGRMAPGQISDREIVAGVVAVNDLGSRREKLNF